MEKGYRDYGHDIDNTDSVLEAGLGFAVDLKKAGGFIGREAVVARKEAGPLTRRLLQVQVLDPAPMLFHAEVVWRNGIAVGYVRAASYGHTLGGAVGLAMVDAGVPLDQAWIDARHVGVGDRRGTPSGARIAQTAVRPAEPAHPRLGAVPRCHARRPRLPLRGDRACHARRPRLPHARVRARRAERVTRITSVTRARECA